MNSAGAPVRPPQIRPTHLDREAVVYLRQSSLAQVREHTGSTEVQRALADLPRQWGWATERIRVIDADLGLSGKFSHNRDGFREVLDRMARREVGLVVVQDSSRLSREPRDWEEFLAAARSCDVLVATDGRVFDAPNAELAELFGLRIKNLLAWYENEHRAGRFKAARIAKGLRGHAVTRPPVGYVVSVKGKWIKDPDPAVREAVDRIFVLILEVGSIRKVQKYLLKNGLLFPTRRRGEVKWEPIASSTLAHILGNRNYTGDYVFETHKSVVDPGTGKRRLVARPQAEWRIVPGHHEAYVAHANWEQIQTALEAARPTVRPPRGRGPAILQGLVRCHRCDKWMRTYHQGRGDSRVASYYCSIADRAGRRLHALQVSARVLDRFVLGEVFRALTPARLDDALVAIQGERDERAGLDKARSRRLQQAEDAFEDARRRYHHVDPENRLVSAHLEAEMEVALRQLNDIKWEIQNPSSGREVSLTAADAARLVELTRDFERLWAAPTTTNEDRKRLLGTILTNIVIHNATDDWIEIELVWVGALRETHRVPTSIGLKKLVDELKNAGFSRLAIMGELQARKLIHLNSRSGTPNAVAQRLYKLGLGVGVEWGAALQIVRTMLVEGRHRSDIIAALRADDAPEVGPWTYPRLAAAIRRLRRGSKAHGIPPMPHLLPEDERRAKVNTIIVRRSAEGAKATTIAVELNAAGLQPTRAQEFTAQLVRSFLDNQRRRAKGRRRPRDRQTERPIGSEV